MQFFCRPAASPKHKVEVIWIKGFITESDLSIDNDLI